MIKYFKTSFSSILLKLQSLHPDLSVLFHITPSDLQAARTAVFCLLLLAQLLSKCLIAMLDDVRVKGLLFAQAQTQPVQMAISRQQRRIISCI